MESGAASIRSRSIARKPSPRQITAPNWLERFNSSDTKSGSRAMTGDGSLKASHASRRWPSPVVARTSKRRWSMKGWPEPRRRKTLRIGRGSPSILAMKKVSRRNGAHARCSMESKSSVSCRNCANAALSRFEHPEKAGQAIRQNIDENIEREAAIDRRELEAKALQHAMGNAHLDQIRRQSRVIERRGQSISVGDAASSPQGAFTTPETIALERENLQLVRAGTGGAAVIGRADEIRQWASGRQLLSDQAGGCRTDPRVERLAHLNRGPCGCREDHDRRHDP